MPSDDDFDLGLSDEEPMTPPSIKPIEPIAQIKQQTASSSNKPPFNQTSKPPVNQKPFSSLTSNLTSSRPSQSSLSLTQNVTKPIPSSSQPSNARFSMTQFSKQSISQSNNQSVNQFVEPSQSEAADESESDWDDDSDAEPQPKQPKQSNKQSNKQTVQTEPSSTKPSMFDASPPMKPIQQSNNQPPKSSPKHVQPSSSNDFEDFDIDDDPPTKPPVHQTINQSNRQPAVAAKKKKPVWESDSEPNSPEPQPTASRPSQSNNQSNNQSIAPTGSPHNFDEAQPGAGAHSSLRVSTDSTVKQSNNQSVNQNTSQTNNQSYQPMINQVSLPPPISPTTIAAQKRIADQAALDHITATRRRAELEAAEEEARNALSKERAARDEFERRRVARLAEEQQRRHEIEMSHRQSVEQSEGAFFQQQREMERSIREARLAREQADRCHRDELERSRHDEKLRSHLAELEKRERDRAEARAVEQAARIERFAQFEAERNERLRLQEQQRVAREHVWKQEDERRREAAFARARADDVERERARALCMEQERARWENDQRELMRERDEEILRYRSTLGTMQKEHEDRVVDLTSDHERRLLQMHEGFELERMRWAQTAETERFRERGMLETTHEQRLQEHDGQWRRQLQLTHDSHKALIAKLQSDLDQSIAEKSEELRVLHDTLARVKRESTSENAMLQSQLKEARDAIETERASWKAKLEDRERMIEDMKISVEEAYKQRMEFTKQLSAVHDAHADVLKQRDAKDRERDVAFADRLAQKHREMEELEMTYKQQVTVAQSALLEVRAVLVASEEKVQQQAGQLEDARLKILNLQREHDAHDRHQVIKFSELKQGLQHVTERLADKQIEVDDHMIEQQRLKSMIAQRDAQLEGQAQDHARWANEKHVDRTLIVQLQTELQTERQHRRMIEDEADRLALIHSECATRAAQQEHETELKTMSQSSREKQLKRELELKQERIATLSRDIERLLNKQDKVKVVKRDDEMSFIEMKRELATLRGIVGDMNERSFAVTSNGDDLFEEKEQLAATTRIEWPFDLSTTQPTDTIRRKLREIESRIRAV